MIGGKSFYNSEFNRSPVSSTINVNVAIVLKFTLSCDLYSIRV